jgi:hypothetical protein
MWPFGMFYGYLVYFPLFGMLHLEKSGNPASDNCGCKKMAQSF